MALQTQWRREFAGMEGVLIWQGLRYTEADVTIRLLGYGKQAREIFEGLQVMESAALPLLNRR